MITFLLKKLIIAKGHIENRKYEKQLLLRIAATSIHFNQFPNTEDTIQDTSIL